MHTLLTSEANVLNMLMLASETSGAATHNLWLVGWCHKTRQAGGASLDISAVVSGMQRSMTVPLVTSA